MGCSGGGGGSGNGGSGGWYEHSPFRYDPNVLDIIHHYPSSINILVTVQRMQRHVDGL
jgi:hypothetical protein